MALSLGDKPNDTKPGHDATAQPTGTIGSQDEIQKSKVAAAKSEEQKSVQQEVEEQRQAQVDAVNSQNADTLSAAAASGDAAVQNLLGQRTIAELNADTEALKDIDKKLGEIVK